MHEDEDDLFISKDSKPIESQQFKSAAYLGRSSTTKSRRSSLSISDLMHSHKPFLHSMSSSTLFEEPEAVGPFSSSKRNATDLNFLLHNCYDEDGRNNSFHESQHSHVNCEPVPLLVGQTSLRSPLFSPDMNMYMSPYPIDCIAGQLPSDAWDWNSYEIVEQSSQTTVVPERTLTIENVLTVDKRGHVVLNFWETELNYVRQLETIQNVFRQKLLERNVITETSDYLIFAVTDELHSFHVKFVEHLRSVVNVESWSTTESRIGKLFLDNKEELERLYTKFIDNFAISQKTLKQEEKKNDEYSNLMKELSKLSETNRQSLRDFLVLPVQRTTRYHILLKDLLKNTPEHHPDWSDLEHAWNAMNELAAIVNEKKRKEEEATGLFDAFEATKNCPPTLISHKRRLIMRVDAVEKPSRREIHLVLCSDLLMVAVPSKVGVLSFHLHRSAVEHPYRFVRWIDLQDMEIHDVSLEEETKDCIRIAIKEPTPTSQTTPAYEITPSFKELSSNQLVVYFSGFDPAKMKADFALAIKTEQKATRNQ